MDRDGAHRDGYLKLAVFMHFAVSFGSTYATAWRASIEERDGLSVLQSLTLVFLSRISHNDVLTLLNTVNHIDGHFEMIKGGAVKSQAI